MIAQSDTLTGILQDRQWLHVPGKSVCNPHETGVRSFMYSVFSFIVRGSFSIFCEEILVSELLFHVRTFLVMKSLL